MSKMRNQRLILFLMIVYLDVVSCSTINSKGRLPLVNGFLSVNSVTHVCYDLPDWEESYLICLNSSVENHYPIRDRYNFSFPEVNVQCQCNCSGSKNMAKCEYDGKFKHCLQSGRIPYKGKDCHCQLIIEAKGDVYQAIQLGNKQRKVRFRVKLTEKASKREIWNHQFLASETKDQTGINLNFLSKPYSDDNLIFDKYSSWFYHRLGSPELLESASINGKDERDFAKIGWFKLYNEQEMKKAASFQVELLDALRNYKSKWFACAANKTVYQWHFQGIGYRREGRIGITQNKTSPAALVDTSSVFIPQFNPQHFSLRVPWNQIKVGLNAVLNSTLTGFHPKLKLEEVSYNPETKEVTTNTFLTVSFDSGTSGFLLGSVNASGSIELLEAIQVTNTKEDFRFALKSAMKNDIHVCFYSNPIHQICQWAEIHCEEQVNVSGANATIAIVILVVVILFNVGLIVWFYRTHTSQSEEKYKPVSNTQPVETPMNDESV